MATLGHFEIVGAENGEKPKSGISITQPLCLIDSFAKLRINTFYLCQF